MITGLLAGQSQYEFKKIKFSQNKDLTSYTGYGLITLSNHIKVNVRFDITHNIISREVHVSNSTIGGNTSIYLDNRLLCDIKDFQEYQYKEIVSSIRNSFIKSLIYSH